MAHECGHVLGLDHPFDTNIPKQVAPFGEYRDPTCIMSARSFGGFPVTFAIPPEERTLLDTNNPFWNEAGPGVSMATMWRYEPNYPSVQSYSHELPPAAPPTAVRLYRAGASGTCLITMPVTGLNSRYTVEYRPAARWDKQLEAPAGVPKAGVVIHRIQNSVGRHEKENDGWPKLDQVCLESIIAVRTTGDLDWNNRDFAVRVVTATPEWVDVIVGAYLPEGQSVTLSAESAAAYVSTYPGESIELSRTGSDCGTHTYTTKFVQQTVTITAKIVSTGFVAPVFRFELNGSRLGKWRKSDVTSNGNVRFDASLKIPISLNSNRTESRSIEASFKCTEIPRRSYFPPAMASTISPLSDSSLKALPFSKSVHHRLRQI